MELQISYYKSDDILLMQNGQHWAAGSNVAENVVAYADDDRNIVGIEISGAAALLGKAIHSKKARTEREEPMELLARPDEVDLDRVSLPLSVSYDSAKDELTLHSRPPAPFEQVIADGLCAYYDGEDRFGKFVNGVRLEHAYELLKPYLAP